MKLNLGAAGGAKSGPSYHEEATAGDVQLSLVFVATGECAASLRVPVGETIAQLKKRVADTHGVAYSSLVLTTEEGTALMDPLSINDVKQFRGKSSVTILVKQQ